MTAFGTRAEMTAPEPGPTDMPPPVRPVARAASAAAAAAHLEKSTA